MELQSEPATVDDAELQNSESNGRIELPATVPVSAAQTAVQKSADTNASHAPTTAERRSPQPSRHSPSLASKLNRAIMFVGALLIAFGCWQAANRSGDSTDSKPSPGIATQRIDRIEVGQQVVAKNPTDDVDLSLGEAIDPAEWRKLELRAPKSDGSWSDITLIRPLAWLESERRSVDGKIRVTVPECGIDGDSELLSVAPCPPVEHIPGCRTVTGVFRHHSADVIDVHVAGLDSPIGATGNHPFWSEDRQDFVRADRLRPGETLRSLDGLLVVIKTTPRPTPQPVYNIEVHLDHVYHVTSAGVLVHNATKKCSDLVQIHLNRPLKGWRSSNALNDLPANATKAQRAKASRDNAKRLRKNLGSNVKPGEHAHHIVASTDKRADRARKLLDRYQIDINSAANGVGLKPKGPKPAHHGTGLHSNDGIDAVTRRLGEAIDGVDDWAKARKALLDELDRIRKEILNGTFP